MGLRSASFLTAAALVVLPISADALGTATADQQRAQELAAQLKSMINAKKVGPVRTLRTPSVTTPVVAATPTPLAPAAVKCVPVVQPPAPIVGPVATLPAVPYTQSLNQPAVQPVAPKALTQQERLAQIMNRVMAGSQRSTPVKAAKPVVAPAVPVAAPTPVAPVGTPCPPDMAPETTAPMMGSTYSPTQTTTSPSNPLNETIQQASLLRAPAPISRVPVDVPEPGTLGLLGLGLLGLGLSRRGAVRR